MVLAAWTKRIPAALTEADAHLGLANRLALPFARRVFLAYPLPGREGGRYRVVGRPIPERSQPVDRAEARRLFGLPEQGRVLVVFGALAGARSINELAIEAFGAEGPPLLHISGERDYPELAGRVRRDDYVLLPATERFGAALSAADLVIARAGGSVWELAAAGTPAILVPYPHATGDHQTRNAEHFVRAGGAVRVPDAELATVPQLARTLLADDERLRAMGEAMRAAARPGAADAIAEELVRLARGEPLIPRAAPRAGADRGGHAPARAAGVTLLAHDRHIRVRLSPLRSRSFPGWVGVWDGTRQCRRARVSARAGASVGRVTDAGRTRPRETGSDEARDGAPLRGRRLWFVGIGGAGLSAYAQVARAWGAEVGGWDRVETPYLAHLEGVRVEVAPEPVVPEGWEVVVSSAYPAVPGRRRSELLAELVALRDSIVVTGAHGKTTTTAMIAHALRETGRDPSWIVGGEVPQLGGNAGAGGGPLVVEGDESDRSVFALRPRVAVLLNVDLDHHTEFGSRAELEGELEAWLAGVPEVVRGAELPPVELELEVPGEHNRRNAAAALAALELLGVPRDEAAAALAGFRGVGRRYELRGEAGGVTVVDDYAHNPAKAAAAIQAARERGAARVLVLFQPHLYSRTRHSARALAAALATADVVAVAEIYPAREQPVPGVTGKLVVEALAELRPGMPVAWSPALESGVAFLARRARAGDVVLTVGAGDVDRAAPLLLEALA